MKLCYFGSDYPPTGGGIATYTVEWLAAVSTSSEVSEIRAYIFGNNQPRTEVVDEKVTVVTKKTRNFFAIGLHTLLYIYKNRDAKAFHALYLFPTGFWMVLWGRLFGIPTIVTVYATDVCSKEGKASTRALKRWTLMKATKVIAISEFTKKAAIDALSLTRKPSDIPVIYNTVPEVKTEKSEAEIVEAMSDLKKECGIDEKSFVLLAVCRLVPRKGIHYLIDAVSRISDTNVKLLVVGGGPEEQRLREQVARLHLTDRIFLLGKVPDLVPVYRVGHISILPSFGRVEEGDFEGLGLVLLEGQSFGLPVIGTNSGGIPEAFDPGVTGILVPEKDPEALAAAIERLRMDRELYRRMAAATHSFLKVRFGLERMLKEYLALMQK